MIRLANNALGLAIVIAAVALPDGRIASVGRRSSVPIPNGVRVIHVEGKTVVPGLWRWDVAYMFIARAGNPGKLEPPLRAHDLLVEWNLREA